MMTCMNEVQMCMYSGTYDYYSMQKCAEQMYSCVYPRMVEHLNSIMQEICDYGALENFGIKEEMLQKCKAPATTMSYAGMNVQMPEQHFCVAKECNVAEIPPLMPGMTQVWSCSPANYVEEPGLIKMTFYSDSSCSTKTTHFATGGSTYGLYGLTMGNVDESYVKFVPNTDNPECFKMKIPSHPLMALGAPGGIKARFNGDETYLDMFYTKDCSELPMNYYFQGYGGAVMSMKLDTTKDEGCDFLKAQECTVQPEMDYGMGGYGGYGGYGMNWNLVLVDAGYGVSATKYGKLSAAVSKDAYPDCPNLVVGTIATKVSLPIMVLGVVSFFRT